MKTDKSKIFRVGPQGGQPGGLLMSQSMPKGCLPADVPSDQWRPVFCSRWASPNWMRLTRIRSANRFPQSLQIEMLISSKTPAQALPEQ